METKRLRAFMNRYGAVGVLCVGAYLVLRRARVHRRRHLIAFGTVGLSLAAGLLICMPRQDAPHMARTPTLQSNMIRVPAAPEEANQDDTHAASDTDNGEDPDKVCSLAFSPDGRVLATGARDGTVRLRDVRTGNVRSILYTGIGTANSLAFTPDGRTLLCAALSSDSDRGSMWARVKQWDLRTKRLLWSVPAYGGYLALSPDGHTLAIGARVSYASEAHRFGKVYPAGGVQLWDLRSHRCIRSLLQENDPCAGYFDFYPAEEVDNLVFSADGKRLFGNAIYLGSCADACCFRLWEVRTGRSVHPESSYESIDGVGIATSPQDGLAAVGDDDQIHLLNARTAASKRVVKTSDSVQDVAFSSDGRLLANTFDYSSTVEVRSVRTGKLLHHYADSDGDSSHLTCLEFSPTGHVLAAGDEYGTVHLWNLDQGSQETWEQP